MEDNELHTEPGECVTDASGFFIKHFPLIYYQSSVVKMSKF